MSDIVTRIINSLLKRKRQTLTLALCRLHGSDVITDKEFVKIDICITKKFRSVEG